MEETNFTFEKFRFLMETSPWNWRRMKLWPTPTPTPPPPTTTTTPASTTRMTTDGALLKCF